MSAKPKKKRTKTIKVDYLARVEGEGALYLKLKGDEVSDVKLRIFEPPRLFEAFHRASNVGPDHLEDSTVKTLQNDTHKDEQRAFFDGIVAGQSGIESVEHAIDVQRVVDAIYRSNDEGQSVRL